MSDKYVSVRALLEKAKGTDGYFLVKSLLAGLPGFTFTVTPEIVSLQALADRRLETIASQDREFVALRAAMEAHEPGKAGTWIEQPSEWRGIHIYKCSECGRTVYAGADEDVVTAIPYCHCGAQMR